MKTSRVRVLSALFVLVAVAWALRAPFLQREQWNLDEGSTFTMAQQIRAGAVLYRDAADNRSPLVPYLKAAIFAVAGDWNVHAVHLTIACSLGLIAFLLWDLARRLGHARAGVWAAGVFTALALVLPGTTDSLAADTERFVILFSTLGFWLLAVALPRGGLLAGITVGFAFGASALCKQPGLLDFVVAGGVILYAIRSQSLSRPRLVQLALGACVGLATTAVITITYFWSQGALRDLIYYAWTFNTKLYVAEYTLAQRLAASRLTVPLAAHYAPVVCLSALFGLLLLLVRAFRKRPESPTNDALFAVLVLGWTLSGLISTGLSGRQFDHYVIQIIPGLSLAAGWLLSRISDFARSKKVAQAPSTKRTLFLQIFAWALLAVVLGAACFDVIRFTKKLTPVDDVNYYKLGRLVQAHTTPSDRIFIWGYFPEFYLAAKRLPSTRYIYTNYVTGMIPWTNIDPLINTRYAVVPDAWKNLTADLHRHPPAVIVDTLGTRGYVKYPLNGQPPLWERVRSEYAQVSNDDPDTMGMRIFRRVAPTQEAFDRSLRMDSNIALTGFKSFRRDEPPGIRVTAPAGVSKIDLYAGTQPIASLVHPAERPVNVLFFAPKPTSPAPRYYAVITTQSGRRVSPAFDFSAYLSELDAAGAPGPALHLNGVSRPPVAVDAQGGTFERRQAELWRILAPAELEYDCPPEIQKISFVHQLVEPAQMLSDGYDLVAEFAELDGHRTRLLLQRLHPLTSGRDQEPQRVRLQLPANHGPGRVYLRFLPGERNNTDADRIDVSDLQTNDAGPELRLGERVTSPLVAVSETNQALKQKSGGAWAAQTPARIEWLRPPALAAVTLQYGIEEGAYTAKEGHSDGVELSLTLIDDDGKTHPLFSQLLTPFNHPEHRGPQTARIEIPPKINGRLILSLGPGPRGDATWDWAWIGPITCEASGPEIVVNSQRHLAPLSSRVVDANGLPSKRDGENRWGAHADAELVYERPAELAHVTFEYGLADGADRDENGKQRSDGVDVIVEFQPADGARQEIFRRNLDPFNRTNDLGLQTSTVELPPNRAGQLIFRITPGPSGNNAFDWGFWGRFTGELSP